MRKVLMGMVEETIVSWHMVTWYVFVEWNIRWNDQMTKSAPVKPNYWPRSIPQLMILPWQIQPVELVWTLQVAEIPSPVAPSLPLVQFQFGRFDLWIWSKYAPKLSGYSVWQGSQGSQGSIKNTSNSGGVRVESCASAIGQSEAARNTLPPCRSPRAFLPVQLPHREDVFELREDARAIWDIDRICQNTWLLRMWPLGYTYIHVYCVQREIYIYIIMYITSIIGSTYVNQMRTILCISYAYIINIYIYMCVCIYIIMPMDG